MKACVAALAVVSVFGFVTAVEAADEKSDAATQSMVRGQVSDIAKNPVGGVEVVLRSEEGKEIARTTTNSQGLYELGCVDMGNYQYEILPTEGFKGHKVVAPLGPNGLEIAWAVDEKKPALASATATGGACAGGVVVAGASQGGVDAGSTAAAGAAGPSGAGSAAAVVGGAAVAGGVGVGIAAGAGAFDSSSEAGSPAQ